MRHLTWYVQAIENLGFWSFVRLQAQKHIIKATSPARLTAKTLAYPVLARRGTSDIRTFNLIFAAREYQCLDHVQEPGLIIDCGANVGYSSAYFLSRFERCIVFAIEPDPENFALLRRNLAPYGSRCRAFQSAIWWRHEPIRFTQPVVQGDEWGRAVEPGVSNEPAVPVITIPEILAMAPGMRISILKIDIEGAELELFGHDTSWLEFVDNIVIEIHGLACREKLLSAICPWRMTVSTHGELTCCVKNAIEQASD
jgi:FkbM family methyltransferase